MNAAIKAIATYIPEDRIVVRDWVEQMEISPESKANLKKLFKFTQARTKPRPREHETPVFMIQDAYKRALEQAALEAGDIDLLIYSGVQKGVVEPAQAHLTACDLGLTRTHCFDISEACLGWMRALEIAELYIQGGKAQNVVIASAITNRAPSESLRKPSHPDDLEDFFAAWTVGAVASVTIVSATEDPGMNLKLTRYSNTAATDDCGLPTHDYPIYTGTPMRKWQPGVFQAFGKRLFATAHDLVETVAQSGLEGHGGESDLGRIVITHSMSKTFYDRIVEKNPLLQAKHYNTYPWSGNITDNTVPVAITQAISDGMLEKDDRVSALINGSGSSALLASFNLGL